MNFINLLKLSLLTIILNLNIQIFSCDTDDFDSDSDDSNIAAINVPKVFCHFKHEEDRDFIENVHVNLITKCPDGIKRKTFFIQCPKYIADKQKWHWVKDYLRKNNIPLRKPQFCITRFSCGYTLYTVAALLKKLPK